MRRLLAAINREFWHLADRIHTIVWLAELIGIRSIALATAVTVVFAIWSYVSKFPGPIIALICLTAFAISLLSIWLIVLLYRHFTQRNAADSARGLVRPASPDIVMLAPKRRYSVVWDPDRNFQIITTPEESALHPPQTLTRLPIFLIKNIGSAVAQDVVVTWTAEAPDFESVVRRSDMFRDYRLDFAGGRFTISSVDNKRSWACAYNSTGVSKLPFLAQSIDNTTFVDLEMPFQVYAFIEVFLAANMPVALENAIATTLRVQIAWALPEKNDGQAFKVKAIATSRRPTGTGTVMIPDGDSGKMRIPPRLMGSISFEVERVADGK